VSVPAVQGQREVALGAIVLEYQLRRSARRTLGITVEPHGVVVVTAPAAVTVEQIETVVRRRAGWIRRQLHEVALLPPPPSPREWVSGETHYYLGRQYRLKVVRAAQAEVRLAGRFFRVTVPDWADTKRIRKLMERWLLEHARATFERRTADLIRTTPRLRLTEPPPLLVRKLRYRWGSCSAEGRVLMNVDAVKLPAGCIDYLLLHELCHLRVPHHGRAFWRLLDACMPEWERWRKRLDQAEL
jgi:predicted metal-dependent hydrolase